MLVEFSVENHRAVRERQTFSMIAADDGVIDRLEPPYHVVKTGLASLPRILVNACLLGANGAGKTSFVSAMAFMVDFVRNSPDRGPDRDIPVEPFYLHSKWRGKPSEFEVIFVHTKTIYRYGFAVTNEQVIEEWLFVGNDKTDRWRRVFERKRISKDGRYDWKTNGLKANGALRIWKSQTRSDTLFLSTSVRNNAKGDMKNAYDWISKNFRTHSLSEGEAEHDYTSSRLDEDGWMKRVRGFFSEVGVSFFDIGMERVRILNAPEFATLPNSIKVEIKGRTHGGKMPVVYFLRFDDKGKPVPMGINSESNGIRSLYYLAGPILDTLDRGSTIVVDEFNLGLHPLVTENMISMFCDRKVNKKNAQLIFTTHDPTTVANAFLERDQIWIVEKEEDTKGTRLGQLPKYNNSHIKNFVRDYLAGGYGGVPEIRRPI